MKAMDTNEDGSVSTQEFVDVLKAKGISAGDAEATTAANPDNVGTQVDQIRLGSCFPPSQAGGRKDFRDPRRAM